MTPTERDELLVRLDERQQVFQKSLDNHLAHHFRYNMYAWSVAVGALITMIFTLLKVA